jgi:hypothetical protein
MSKTIEDVKNEITDKIKSLIKHRDSLILSINDDTKEIDKLTDRLYSLDPSKVRIECVNCHGTGISPNPSSDGKKHVCEVCYGPGRAYMWANTYIPEKPKVEIDED